MTYRAEATEVHKEAHWTFWKFLPLFLVVVIILTVVGFGLRSAGLFGSTVVERKVFEHSYQRSEAMKARIAVDEATLAEINRMLMNPSLEDNIRHNLKAQAAAARIRIATTRGVQ